MENVEQLLDVIFGRDQDCQRCGAPRARNAARLCRACANPSYALKKRYGITLEDYDAMLERQGGVCAICCSSNPSGNGERFAVDHDHETGEIRGLLCVPCNAAIGMLNDDPEVLRRAADYIELPSLVNQ